MRLLCQLQFKCERDGSQAKKSKNFSYINYVCFSGPVVVYIIHHPKCSAMRPSARSVVVIRTNELSQYIWCVNERINARNKREPKYNIKPSTSHTRRRWRRREFRQVHGVAVCVNDTFFKWCVFGCVVCVCLFVCCGFYYILCCADFIWIVVELCA